MSEQLTWVQLDRYFAGECSADEADTVRTVLQSQPDTAQLLEDFRQQAIGGPSAAPNDALWKRLATQIEERPSTKPANHTSTRIPTSSPRAEAPRRSSTVARGLQWGGLIAGLLLVGVVARDLPSVRGLFQRQPAAPAMREFRTAAGQRLRLTLPDSSTVILAPQSVIRYAAAFGSSSDRTIALEGQGLFTVTHSAGVPFVVKTADVTTRVLGTSFAVRRYAADTAVRVVVAQGRVAVGNAVLTTGDVAIATAKQPAVISRDNAVNQQLAWSEGRLVFSQVQLREVIPELERWYGIVIRVSDQALLDRRVWTTLDTPDATTALEEIAFAIKGRVQVTGRQAVIHPL